MSTSELKISLHKMIDGVSDTSILEAIYVLLSKTSSEANDWGENISSDSLKSIKKGIEDLKKGKSHSNEEAFSRIQKKITGLKNA